MISFRRDWRGAARAAICISAVVLIAGCKNAEPERQCVLKPVLMEEFDELSVSPNTIGPARWISHTPWNGDFGDARFTDHGPGGPFAIHNGILNITAKKDASGQWTSGLLAAADSAGRGRGAQYGYFEARIQMPTGPGTWPAFWLGELKPVKKREGYRDGFVEIDVIEYYGHSTGDFQSVVHVWYDDETGNLDPSKKFDDAVFIDVPKGMLEKDFHTYGVDISPESVTYFLDGKEFWRHPTPRELDAPMYPLVNLALGSGWPIDKTPNPVVMKVDYIRVWERSAIPPQGCKPGPPA